MKLSALAAVALLGVGLFFGFQRGVDIKGMMEDAVLYIESKGESAIQLYMLLTFIGVICMVPTTLMEFAGGFLFSPKYGVIVTWVLTCVAKLCANVVAVWIARNFLRDLFTRQLVEKSELLTMVSKAVKEEPFKMAFLVRGSMAPLSVKNYGLAVLDIGYLPIALGGLIFTPFYAIQNIYFGSLCKDLKEVFAPQKVSAGGGGGWTSSLKAALPVVFNILLAVFLFRAIKAQMRKQRAAMEASVREKTQKAE